MTEQLIAEQNCHFTWLDITNPEAGELQAIAAQYDLPDALVRDCLEPTHLPKFESTNGLNFVILRVYVAPPTSEADTIQELTTKIAVFYTADRLITVHRRAHPVLSQLKKVALAPGQECTTPAEVSIHLARYALNSYVQPALALTKELDDYEAEIFLKKEVPNALQGLYFLKRKASVARQLLMLTRDILTMLRRQTAAGTADAMLLMQDTQDLQTKVETLYQQLDSAATNLMNLVPVALLAAHQRGHAGANGVLGLFPAADFYCRHLRHELPVHARTDLEAGLPRRAGEHGADRRGHLLVV
jgi:magnesium transporter